MNIKDACGFTVYLVMFFTCPTIGNSATIHIPADKPTIQAGIDAAVNGDTVLVAPGSYVENIDFLGKAITVKSTDGAEETIIDGGSPSNPDIGSVIIFSSGEGADSVLEGFTISGGLAEYGGGIFCWISSPSIINNAIQGNSAFGHPWSSGGGIFCYCSSSSIIDNTIYGNCADKRGGGIYCEESSLKIVGNSINENSVYFSNGGGIDCISSSPFISNNTIIGNDASEQGGGISCSDSFPIISDNEIRHNVASVGGGVFCYNSLPTITHNFVGNNAGDLYGGGIFYFLSAGVIADNTISTNIAGHAGGGIRCTDSSSPLITGNIICWNSADNHGGGISCALSSPTISNNNIYGNIAIWSGGGLTFDSSDSLFTNNTVCWNITLWSAGGIGLYNNSSVIITNSILWDNSAPGGPEIELGTSSALTISYSDVKGGQSHVYLGPVSTLNWGSGMIDSDPLFVNVGNNDFHLTYQSPCRNTGDNSSVTELNDLEGDPRIAYDTVDIGTDEFYTHFYCLGSCTPGGSIEGKLVGLPGTAPTGILFGSGLLDPPVHQKWGDFHLEAPWFVVGSLGSIPANGIMVIQKTLPTTPAAPYDLFMQALIGLNSDSLTNSFVMEVR